MIPPSCKTPFSGVSFAGQNLSATRPSIFSPPFSPFFSGDIWGVLGSVHCRSHHPSLVASLGAFVKRVGYTIRSFRAFPRRHTWRSGHDCAFPSRFSKVISPIPPVKPYRSPITPFVSSPAASPLQPVFFQLENRHHTNLHSLTDCRDKGLERERGQPVDAPHQVDKAARGP